MWDCSAPTFTAEGLVTDLSKLDARERAAHEKVWKERERLVTRTKETIDEIVSQIMGTMEREDGAARGPPVSAAPPRIP